MKERSFTMPEIELIAVTRVLLGLGLGLLLAEKVNGPRRKDTGWALLTVGGLSTIPILLNIWSKRSRQSRDRRRFALRWLP